MCSHITLFISNSVCNQWFQIRPSSKVFFEGWVQISLHNFSWIIHVVFLKQMGFMKDLLYFLEYWWQDCLGPSTPWFYFGGQGLKSAHKWVLYLSSDNLRQIPNQNTESDVLWHWVQPFGLWICQMPIVMQNSKFLKIP